MSRIDLPPLEWEHQRHLWITFSSIPSTVNNAPDLFHYRHTVLAKMHTFAVDAATETLKMVTAESPNPFR